MSTSEQAETATTRREIPLAYDANGEPLNVPENAIAWRVRRGGGRRGRPVEGALLASARLRMGDSRVVRASPSQ